MGTNQQPTSNSGEAASSAAGAANFRFGITSPISESTPTDDDLKRTESLDKCLRNFRVYESDEELNSRMEVLRKINCLVKEWVKEVSLNKVPVFDIFLIKNLFSNFIFGNFLRTFHQT